ncbi:MAG: hypothetical protein K6G48_06700 [Acholeplasmatales bacterium]|nr:hypothetical protein [Acholeplasmatales bacterium]
MIENIMEGFGIVMLVLSILSLLKYIVLTKKYPKALKTFAISVIAFFIFAVFFCIVETILFYKVRVKSKIDGQVIFYAVMSILYAWNVIVLYYIASYRLILLDDHMIYFNIIGRKKKYYYKDVTDFKTDPVSGYFHIYFGKKKIEVPYFIDGQLEVLNYINDKK